MPPSSVSGLPDQSASRSRGPFTASTQQLDFPFAQHSRSTDSSAGLSTPSHLSTSSALLGQGLLAPSQLRSRSKSDTSLQPPLWDNFINHQLDQNRSESALLHNNNYNSGNNGTVNLKDILPAASEAHQPSIQPQPPSLTHNFTFPPAQPSIDNQFLSPDISASNLRRSKSDSAGRPLHRRQSRSEDMSTRTATMSAAHLFPPTSQQDFMARQYLHPGEANGVMPIRGHTRRASSGSRHDRSISGGSSNWSGSTRPSPYPSPSASPRFMDRDLPALHSPPKPEDVSNVMKPQVTTGRTELASHQRRTHPANFVCPVPGCGSTFTRSFNLKGNLNSFLTIIWLSGRSQWSLSLLCRSSSFP
jgi:hypothetical protein